MKKSETQRITGLVLKAVALAMGVVSIVMGFIPDAADMETTDFQAVGFYEKRGYHIFARLENQPPGHM
jgi:ribosomal protein S18 acetylase RimI-like enzyme